MKHIEHIDIPETCNQSWEQMAPTGNNRYCGQCCKTVIDFTKMTNDEIITFLATKNDVCGRFEQHQLPKLNYQLRDENISNRFNWKRWVVAAGLLGVSFLTRGSAQTKATVSATQQRASAITYNTLGKVLAIDTFKNQMYIRRHTHKKAKNAISNAKVIPRERDLLEVYRSDISNNADGFKELAEAKVCNVAIGESMQAGTILGGVVGGITIVTEDENAQSWMLKFYQYLRWPITDLIR